MITIYQLKNTSEYNISACHSATSATLDYKNTLSQYISLKIHQTTIFQLAIQPPQQLSTTSRLQDTLSQYNTFKLHFNKALTISKVLVESTKRTHDHNISASNYIRLQYFSLPFSNLSNCRLKEHIITIYQLKNTSDYNISACHSATSATVD